MNKLLEMIEQKVMLPAAAVSVFIMCCLTSFDAGARYLLNSPIIGAYEITEKYLMVFCFYLGVNYAYRKGANIRVTLLVSRLPAHIKLSLNYIIQIIAIFYCLFLLVAAIETSLPRMTEKVYLTAYTLPLAPVYIVMPLGLILLNLRMILDLWQIRQGRSGLFVEEEEPDESMTI